MACSNCGNENHNKRTCKNPAKTVAPREVAPVFVAPAAPQKVEPIVQEIGRAHV